MILIFCKIWVALGQVAKDVVRYPIFFRPSASLYSNVIQNDVTIVYFHISRILNYLQGAYICILMVALIT